MATVRVDLAGIGPIHRHRRQDASAVVIEDAVLAPRVVSRHELERAPGQRMEGMGDAEKSMRSRAITSI